MTMPWTTGHKYEEENEGTGREVLMMALKGDWVAVEGNGGVLNYCRTRILADNSEIYGMCVCGRSLIFRGSSNEVYRGIEVRWPFECQVHIHLLSHSLTTYSQLMR